MRMLPRYWPTRQEAAAIAAQPKAVTFVFNGEHAAMILPPEFTDADDVALRAAVERTNHLKTNGGRGMRT